MSAKGRGPSVGGPEDYYTPPPDLRPIPGTAGYLAGSDGHIYSTKLWRGSAFRRLAEGRDRDGYPTVQLARGPGGGRRTDTRVVHRLMAAAFLPPRPAGQEVRHADGVKTNNMPTNLVWGTQQDNADDRERHGRTVRGMLDGNAVLTEEIVRQIKATGIPRGSGVALAKKFGVSQPTISAIKVGRIWGWV